MHQDTESGAGFGVGVLAGVVVGAGLALLFAPKAGTKMREDIGQSMDTLRQAVASRYRDLAQRAGVEIDNLQDKVERATAAVDSIARDTAETAADRARSTTGAMG